MLGLKLNNFHSLEVVGRGSEPQLQVSEFIVSLARFAKRTLSQVI